MVDSCRTQFDGTKMVAYFRNDGWKEDISRYIKQGLQRQEILDFFFAWSIRTVDRRLRYFDIYYHDKNVSVDEEKEAVKKELDGPGKLLGYRAMHHKVWPVPCCEGTGEGNFTRSFAARARGQTQAM